MKVIHIISGLKVGGAEMMLFKLLGAWDRQRDEIEVISLTEKGVMGEKIASLGVPVIALGMPRGRPSLGGLVRLTRHLRKSGPAIIHCWMYHGNLIGGLAARLAGQRIIIWGIRSSNLDEIGNRRSTLWTVKAGAKLSGLIPRKVVCCSENAGRIHVALGYRADKMLTIPNGFDLGRFKPDAEAREAVRRELNVPGAAVLIGFVARFDPQKDHRNFIEAARRLAARTAGVHFLMCGERVDWANPELAGWIDAAGLRDRFHLLGRRDDVPRVTAALDLAACASAYGEAFPNVLGEAMACGVPCVSTDVGDSAYIVGDTGLIVPPRAPDRLADAWWQLIERGPAHRQELGRAARQRVADKFELNSVAASYAQLYRDLVAEAAK